MVRFSIPQAKLKTAWRKLSVFTLVFSRNNLHCSLALDSGVLLIVVWFCQIWTAFVWAFLAFPPGPSRIYKLVFFEKRLGRITNSIDMQNYG